MSTVVDVKQIKCVSKRTDRHYYIFIYIDDKMQWTRDKALA